MAERASRAPAIIASVLLHAALLGSTLIAWPWGAKPRAVEVTPVTLLTSDDIARLSSSAQSDVPQLAQTPDPTPDAPPEPVAETPAPEPEPAAAPKPAPAQPAPQPKPTPAPAVKTPTPTPAKPAPPSPPTRARPRTMDDIAASIAAEAARKPTGAPRPGGNRDPLAQIAANLEKSRGEAASRATASAVGAIAAKLSRLWNPNCGMEGSQRIVMRVRLTLARDGRLISAELPDYPTQAAIDAIKDPAVKAAAFRAKVAASAGSPYEGLPPETYDDWRERTFRLRGDQACANR